MSNANHHKQYMTKNQLWEVQVNLPIVLLLEGMLFVVVFGALSLLRREGLSGQFALEGAIITLITSGFTLLTGFPTQPVLFLVVLYLLTMRVRLLVDIGNIFAQRKMFNQADRLYTLAARLWPDRTSYLIVRINLGTLRLHQDALDEAIDTFKDILQKSSQGYLGIKHEAVTHYNLGVAYRRKKLEPQAISEFAAVLDTWPTSEYARRAEAALAQGHHKEEPSTVGKDTPSEK
jgi:tetratricopeptide (TPR) repeat protein